MLRAFLPYQAYDCNSGIVFQSCQSYDNNSSIVFEVFELLVTWRSYFTFIPGHCCESFIRHEAWGTFFEVRHCYVPYETYVRSLRTPTWRTVLYVLLAGVLYVREHTYWKTDHWRHQREFIIVQKFQDKRQKKVKKWTNDGLISVSSLSKPIRKRSSLRIFSLKSANNIVAP